MKFLGIILFYVYINSASSKLLEEEHKRFVVKQFTKKALPGLFQINYSGKYLNKARPYKAYNAIPTSQSKGYSYAAFDSMHYLHGAPHLRVSPKSHAKSFTAFIPLDHPHAAKKPDSLFFPQYPPDEKPMLSEVLPDHVWTSLRKKRSADHAIVQSNKADNKTEPKALQTDEKKDAKHVKETGDKHVEPKVNKHVEKKEDKAVGRKEDKHVEKKGDKAVGRKGDKHVNKRNKDVKKKGVKHVEQKRVRLARKKPAKKLRKGHKTKHVNGMSNKPSGNKNGKRTKLNKKQAKRHGKGKSPVRRRRRHFRKSLINDTRRLIAGRDALIEQYPYAISIQKNDEHWCAGAILNPRLIITTANCLWKSSQISRLKVRVGSRFNNHGGQTFQIQEVMKHPGWKIRNNPDCDVALALLDGNIRFSHSVHSVDLPNIAMMPAFDDAWVVSWGSERRDGIFDAASNSLQVYHVRLMDKNKCNNVTKRFGVIVTENFICLAQTGRRAPCTRDTGAPAVSDGVLWGLASWGIRKLCGTERYPAMFTYLASPSNIDFIANATHLLMSEQRYYPFPDRLPLMRAAEPTSQTASQPDLLIEHKL